MKQTFQPLFLLILLLLTCQLIALQQTTPTIADLPPAVSYHPSHHQQEDNFNTNTRNIHVLTGNDGGNSQNNGSGLTDNGQWQFYGSQQPAQNQRADNTSYYSSYVEKTILVLTNWARMSPKGFKVRFNSLFKEGVNLTTTTGWGLAPLFEHFNLNEAARYHSYDMSASNCFSHNSCDGEGTFVRVRTFYNMNVGMAENIAAGHPTPLSVTMGWINSEGHRKNLLGVSYTLLGVGHFPRIGAANYSRYWTQNFAGGPHGISNPIVSLTHIQLTAGQLTFLSNYYHKNDLIRNRKLQSIVLYLEGTGYAMTLPVTNQFNDTLTVAVGGMGTYEVVLPANTTASAGCRKYYVKAVDSEGYQYYYPSYGYLLTQDENSGCKSHYLAQKKDSEIIIPPVTPSGSTNGTKVSGASGNNHLMTRNGGYMKLVVLVVSMVVGLM